MIQFIQDIPHNALLIPGLIAGILASFACGSIGPYVITKRIVFLSGAIAHMAIGGIGAAILIRYHWMNHLLSQENMVDASQWFAQHPWGEVGYELFPTIGAVAAAMIGALLIGIAQEHLRERIDTLIGAMWAIGMSLGILMIKLTPGYHTELMSYLFGNISYANWIQVWFILALDVIITIVLLLFHKRLLAICLDEQQAKLQGINITAMNIILLGLVAMTVICLIQVVGLILVIALLTLPAATAGHYVQRLSSMVWIAIGLSLMFTTIPRMMVYGTKMSPESAIVLAAGVVYLASWGLSRIRLRRRAVLNVSR